MPRLYQLVLVLAAFFNREISACDPSCSTCSGTTSSTCSTCATGLSLQGPAPSSCSASCPDGTASSGGTCLACTGELPPILNLSASVVLNNVVTFVASVPHQALSVVYSCTSDNSVSALTQATTVQLALGANNCYHTYDVSFPWAYFGTTCVLYANQGVAGNVANPPIVIASGGLTSAYQVNQGLNRGQAVLNSESSVLDFEIEFPVEQWATVGGVTVYSAFGLVADVSATTMITTPPTNSPSSASGTGSGSFTIQTSVQWPYSLNSATAPVFTSIAGVIVSAPTVVNTNCLAAATSPCRQTWTYTYAAASPACSLTGTYTIVFTMGCTSASNCPLNGGEMSTVAISLTSGTICGVIAPVQVPNSVIVTSTWQDSAHTIPKTNFMAGVTTANAQTMYVTALVTSTAVTIASVSIRTLAIVTPAAITLFTTPSGSPDSAGAATTAGTAAQLTISNSPVQSLAGQVAASFSVLYSQFGLVAGTDANTPATLSLILDVQFVDVSSMKQVVMNMPIHLQSTNPGQAAATVSFAVTAPSNSALSNQSPVTSPLVSGLEIAAIVCVAATACSCCVFFLCRSKRNKKKTVAGESKETDGSATGHTLQLPPQATTMLSPRTGELRARGSLVSPRSEAKSFSEDARVSNQV
jgi:hypothetical protein